MNSTTPLWWNEARMTRIREAIAEGNPDACFLESRTRAQIAGDEEAGCYGLESRAVIAWLDQNRADAAAILEQWGSMSRTVPNSNLGEAGWALSGAVMLDVLMDLVPENTRIETASGLWRLVRALRVPGKGNPHTVTNNWWAVTHGAALCAALAAQRVGEEHIPGYDPDAVPWALGRLRAFCHHFGPAGLYHEGLGYIRYTSIFVLSACMAARSSGAADLLTEFPNLRLMLPGLYAATSARSYQDDTTGSAPKWGASLSWNDMGSGAGVTAVDHIGMAIAPESMRPALKAWFDRLSGLKTPEPDLGGHHACIPMAWAHYPVDLPEADPNRLPREVLDTRQGLLFWRNRFQDSQDVVFGVYSKATHIGGHVHEDAGSLRLDAFGADWIAGPGQARTGREGQSVMFPASDAGPNCGFFTYQESLPDGIRLGLDLRKAGGAYHERLVSLHTSPPGGAKLALAVLDVVDDHRGRDWHWNLTCGNALSVTVDADQQGVRLRAADGTLAQLRFLAAKPETLEVHMLPDSTRTFSSGRTETYRGKPVIRARFAPQPRLAVLAGIIWGQAEEDLDLNGNEHALHIRGEEWVRPFGAALPAGFIAGTSPGPSQHSLP